MFNFPDDNKKIKLKTGKVAIMGGTFDPIHFGHLVTAEAARVQYGFDYVIFIPSGQPPHKAGKKITSATHRYIMTVLATMSNSYFRVSSVEIEREGPSYTIDTLMHFREQYGTGVELYFITGADAMQEILTWKAVPEILSICQFIAATRPGYRLAELERVKEAIGAISKERIHCVATPEIDISSTVIRERLKERKSIKYLVPETVEHYIYKQGLYGAMGNKGIHKYSD
jgi:nicotinate-nucleotide adenylyltransferase